MTFTARHVGAAVVAASAFAAAAGAAYSQVPAGAPAAGARIDRGTFTWQRRIPPGAPGVSWLRLDLAALAHSRIADIRLVSSTGFQVPYLLESDADPLRVSLPPLVVRDEAEAADRVSQLRGRHRTVYALSLPLARMPPCNLVLETPARVFERGVSVLTRGDVERSAEARRWETRAWETWRHADPGEAAPALVIGLPTLDTADARVVVDEGDNQPLPLEQPALEVRTWRLRFVRETGDELWLVYGRRDLAAPRYDLALLETRLRDEPASEVTAVPEATPVEAPGARRPAFVFWGALVVAVVVLLVVLARLLGPQAPGPGPEA